MHGMQNVTVRMRSDPVTPSGVGNVDTGSCTRRELKGVSFNRARTGAQPVQARRPCGVM